MSDKETDPITSPTGRYSVKATVNRTDESTADYAYVIIHVFDGQTKLYDFNSRAGDFNKWALGWTKRGDTIVLQTSDIGDRAWTIDSEGPNAIEMTPELHGIANELKVLKYE
ncbi:MAG: hypothetical protein OEX22_09815 [Cyclobacteriaceae bacterium]|nr:hypothetical protein [Cyclobacteriaceae bacterium]